MHKDAKYWRDYGVLDRKFPKGMPNELTAVRLLNVSPLNYRMIERELPNVAGDRFLIVNVLKDEKLFDRIIKEELSKKITGEEQSAKAIFLSLCSVWLKNVENPLHSLVSSESSAGKSYVCKKIVDIFPSEIVEYRSKITPEAFTYWKQKEKEWSWDGKIVYLEDISQNILDSSTFKVMCSEGSVSTIVKNQTAIDIRIEGVPVVLVTTARTNPSSEVLNRFQIISLDESSSQTEQIAMDKALQKKKEKYSSEIVEALGLLKRYAVNIPYAMRIFSYIKEKYSFDDLRMRRDFGRLLDLIRSSAVLHQFNREINADGELIAEEQDYQIARECINYISTTTLKGLTHKLAKAYECCVAMRDEFDAKSIHSQHPIASLPMWYRYLEELVERGLLQTRLKEMGGYDRDGKLVGAKRVLHYSISAGKKLNLPEYNELPEVNDV